MPITKVTTRNTKTGVASPGLKAKRNKRAGNKRHVSVPTVSDQNHTDAEDVPISSTVKCPTN